MASQIHLKFSEIDWGEDDAKNDNGLVDYFVKCPHFDKILEGKKRYLIGRKGTGKSAILQYIRMTTDYKNFSRDISLRDLPINDFRSLGDRAHRDKSKYVAAWKFILLTELIRMMAEDQSIDDRAAAPLKQFLETNFKAGYSIADTIRVLKSKENKVHLSYYAELGAERKTQTEQSFPLHFNEASKHLAEMVKNARSESTFYLLIDELDEGYKSNDKSLNVLILALLRATEEIYGECKAVGLKVVPLVALRSDIFDRLEDNDLNKLDDFVYRFNWTTNTDDPWSLQAIVENRIRATLTKRYRNVETANIDCWKLVSDEETVKPKGLWQYLCILTFTRPRDIVKMMKCCNEVKTDLARLDLATVQKAEIAYSDWFYREFRDEAQSFLPCWNSVLNCLSEIADGKEKIARLHDTFLKKEDIRKWLESEKKDVSDITKILFDYSVIGCINTEGRWIFKYKDSYFEFMPTYLYYCIHYGFCKKLRIKKNYESTVIQEAYKQYS